MNPQEQASQTAQAVETAPNTTVLTPTTLADAAKKMGAGVGSFLTGFNAQQTEEIKAPPAEAVPATAPAFTYDTGQAGAAPPTEQGTVGIPVNTSEATVPQAATGDQVNNSSASVPAELGGLQPPVPEGIPLNQSTEASASTGTTPDQGAAVAADAANPYGTTAVNEGNTYAAGTSETANPYAPAEQPAAPMAQQVPEGTQQAAGQQPGGAESATGTAAKEPLTGELHNPYADNLVATATQSGQLPSTQTAGADTAGSGASPAATENVVAQPIDTALPNTSMEAPVSIAVPTDTTTAEVPTPIASPTEAPTMMDGSTPVEQTIAQADTVTAAVAGEPAPEAGPAVSIDELINTAIKENREIMNKEIEDAAIFLKQQPTEALRALADYRRNKEYQLKKAA